MNYRILLGGFGGCVLLGVGIIIGYFAIPQDSEELTENQINTGFFLEIFPVTFLQIFEGQHYAFGISHDHWNFTRVLLE